MSEARFLGLLIMIAGVGEFIGVSPLTREYIGIIVGALFTHEVVVAIVIFLTGLVIFAVARRSA